MDENQTPVPDMDAAPSPADAAQPATLVTVAYTPGDEAIGNPPFAAVNVVASAPIQPDPAPAADPVVTSAIAELAHAQALPEITAFEPHGFPLAAPGTIERFMEDTEDFGRRVMLVVHDATGMLRKLHLPTFGEE